MQYLVKVWRRFTSLLVNALMELAWRVDRDAVRTFVECELEYVHISNVT